MQTNYFDLRNSNERRPEYLEKIRAAAAILRRGGLVGIPTETVYGLAANGLDGDAVRRIFEAKGRPQDNPLILHVAGAQWLPRYCRDVPPLAYLLARKFWPGPLTMVLKAAPCVPKETTAGLETVAMRCPDHPVTLAIIKEAGLPIAAPSANTSGRPSCTTAQDVLEDMNGKIDGIVDGGACSVGVESTILDLTVTPPKLLRPGGLPLEAIETVVGEIDIDKAVVRPMKEGEQPRAPGMKYRHYAPKAPVTVFTGAPADTAKAIRQQANPGDGVICFSEFFRDFPQQIVHDLGGCDDKLTQAQRVFDALRAFDGTDVPRILAQCPDETGLGLAVANRLKKAAGFHVVEADDAPVVFGITGGSGCGKTTVLSAIRTLGGTVIDADDLYREMLREDAALKQDILAEFPGAFNSAGELERQKLGQQVFSDKKRLSVLNEIIYRHMVPEIRRRISGGGLYAIDAINLFESGVDCLCDYTVAVTAPVEVRVRRIMERDHVSEEYARMRISAQKPDEFYRSRCDLELKSCRATPEEFREEAENAFIRISQRIRREKQMGK